MHLADLTNMQFFLLTLISLGICYAVATAIALVNDRSSADRDISSRVLEPAAPDSALKHRDDGGPVVATVNVAQRRGQHPVASPSAVRAVPIERLKARSDPLMN